MLIGNFKPEEIEKIIDGLSSELDDLFNEFKYIDLDDDDVVDNLYAKINETEQAIALLSKPSKRLLCVE